MLSQRAKLQAFAVAMLLGGAGLAEAQPAGDVAIFRVDQAAARRVSERERFLRDRPYIAIYEVQPPAVDLCAPGAHCWPQVRFFFSNPSPSTGQTMKVDCSAFDKGGTKLASGEARPEMLPSEAGVSSALLEGAEFDRFATVECRIASVEPNSYRRR